MCVRLPILQVYEVYEVYACAAVPAQDQLAQRCWLQPLPVPPHPSCLLQNIPATCAHVHSHCAAVLQVQQCPAKTN